ncbi:hypothetical protein FHG66_03610 [Rubellimicrobium rubrum]|uniref:Uncharacterized protein n=1 Tax=Rubellimicrobium rubrum TaxID=2585369 RepID=A0A5C4N4X3_9RHOB|nr:hypothetical protein [Rubellimicrobium rubrum]TNC51910.1 hypothetical protein FHG66_03610 [Rubellimicrobium rubrum]
MRLDRRVAGGRGHEGREPPRHLVFVRGGVGVAGGELAQAVAEGPQPRDARGVIGRQRKGGERVHGRRLLAGAASGSHGRVKAAWGDRALRGVFPWPGAAPCHRAIRFRKGMVHEGASDA